jgi:hypothetical protein
MLETPLPLRPALWATLPAPDPARLLEELATLRLEKTNRKPLDLRKGALINERENKLL